MALSSDAWPTELVLRPRTLARGMVEVSAPVGVELSGDRGERLLSAPLAVHAGVTDWLTAGVGHTRGFCLVRADGGCSRAYDDLRVDAVARFYSAGPLSAAYGVVLAASLGDAFALSAEAQLEARLSFPRLALVLAPSYGAGLNRRDTVARIEPSPFPLATSLAFGPAGTAPNRETAHLPLVAELQATSRLALAAGIALDAVLDPVAGSSADRYRVPAGFAAVLTPARTVDVGAALTFPDLGPSRGARARSGERVVEAFLALRSGGSRSPPAAATPAAPRVARAASAPTPAPCPAPAPAAPAPEPVPAVAVAEAPAQGSVPEPAPAGAAPVPARAELPAAEPNGPYLIEIEGFTYAPLLLEVPPGATVTVRNLDEVPHSVTSESAPGAFTPGAVAGVSFDTGAFTGERTFTIPENAPPGTDVPYYCSVHRARMGTPDGMLRIAAPR